MEAVLIYLGKMLLTSGLMYGYYQLFLKDKTFHHYNRFYLLGTILIALLLPLLKVSYFTIDINNDIYLLINKLRPVSTEVYKETMYVPSFLAAVIVLISLLLTLRFAYGVFKILKLKHRFPKEEFEGIRFYQTDLSNAPFSYFRNLFWKNNISVHSDLGKQIMKHEMVHIEQKHTYDKIMIEVIKAIFWFNPFFHLIKKEVHLIHEYLADNKAIKQSDTKAFAQMLLASHFSGSTLPAVSPFLNTHLKKRLQMIKTSKTKFGYARKALALPLIFSIAFACVVHAQNKEIEAANSEITQAVNEMEKITNTTKPEITNVADEDKKQLKESEQPAAALQQDEMEISDLDQQIRKVEKRLELLDPVSEQAAAEFEQIRVLSEKISEIVNSEDFKSNITILSNNSNHYTNVLSKEELAAVKEAAAWAKEAGAAALEDARAAINEAATSKAAAAASKKEAAQAKAAADIARKEAAVARELAIQSKEQLINR